MNKKPFIHPYIPNSVPEIKKKMLAEIGVKDIEELYEDIPPELRLKRDLNLPEPLLSELELRRHMEAVLDQNISCAERPSFLGGGCARHYVPAICDEIAHRSEFLTAYAGEPYEDAGRFQALFEYESLMAELLDFDVVNVPTYDCRYGADLACGDIQGLGNHMYYGGSLGGFIATRDEEKFVMEYPSRLFGIARTSVEGEWGFGDVAYSRTSFDKREKGKEFIGTAAALYGIAAAVYLALMGPQGMRELGTHILQKARYAAMKLAKVPGIRLRFHSTPFKEFVVDFNHTGKSMSEVNERLLEEGIFGGKNLSGEFPELAGCALVAVTEMTTQADIDKLAAVLKNYPG
jgi:glycine cleavage system pyridoxal-binding protein P